jgi:AraC-like DNA-binding protein
VISEAPSTHTYVATGRALCALHNRLDEARSWPVHRHEEHELLWVRSGEVAVQVGQHRWALPSSQALWVPAGVAHAARADAGSTFICTYLHADVRPPHLADPGVVTVVAATPLLAALLGEFCSGPGLSLQASDHAEALVADLLRPVDTDSFAVPFPSSAPLRRIAAALWEQPADDRSVEQWARYAGLSDRTLARRWRSETGLSVQEWRSLLRLTVARRRLESGAGVAETARSVGYLSPSAFISWFRRHTGTTPGQLDRLPA